MIEKNEYSGKFVWVEPQISIKEAMDSIIRQNEMIVRQNMLIMEILAKPKMIMKEYQNND